MSDSNTWHGTILPPTPEAPDQPHAQGTGTPSAPVPKRNHNLPADRRKPGPPRTIMTTEQQQQSVTLAAAGWSQERIAKATGRSRESIKRHLDKPEVMDMVVTEREEMIEIYRDRSRACAVAITDDKISKASALQLATASGILLDKSLLLSGQPTSIHVTALVDVLDVLRVRSDEEIERQWQQSQAPHSTGSQQGDEEIERQTQEAHARPLAENKP